MDLRLSTLSLLAASLAPLALAAACSGAADLGGTTATDPSDLGGGSSAEAGGGGGGGGANDASPPEAGRDAGSGGEDGGYTRPDDAGTCATEPPPHVGDPVLTGLGAGAGATLRFVWTGGFVDVEQRVERAVAPTSDPPLDPAVNSGHWVELRDAAGALLFTQSFFDPTSLEAPGPEGGFTRVPVAWCTTKRFQVDVANVPGATWLHVYASPYGTNDRARRLESFYLTP